MTGPRRIPSQGAPWIKLLLGCGLFGFLMVVAGGVWLYRVIDNAIVRDPVELAAVTEEITPGAEIPDGYEVFGGINIFGLKGVMITATGANPSAASSTMILVGSVSASSSVNLELGMRQGFADDTGEFGEVEVLGEEKIKVGGFEIAFEVVRATSESGNKMLQYSGELSERNGRRTMLIFIGPENGFDRQAMNSFLASISIFGRNI